MKTKVDCNRYSTHTAVCPDISAIKYSSKHYTLLLHSSMVFFPMFTGSSNMLCPKHQQDLIKNWIRFIKKSLCEPDLLYLLATIAFWLKCETKHANIGQQTSQLIESIWYKGMLVCI